MIDNLDDDKFFLQTMPINTAMAQAAIENSDEKRRTLMALEVATQGARISSLDKRMVQTHASFERTLRHVSETAAADIKEVKRSVWVLELVAFASLLLILYSLWPR